MHLSFVHRMIIATCLLIYFGTVANAQEYISPTKPAETGKSPNLKVKVLDSKAQSQTFALIFANGDEVVSGLTEFAMNHQVRSAIWRSCNRPVVDGINNQ